MVSMSDTSGRKIPFIRTYSAITSSGRDRFTLSDMSFFLAPAAIFQTLFALLI